MRILAIDVGTGTQDILLFDSSQDIENCIKMIMPSPTAIIAHRIRKATAKSKPILFTGWTMGGGPNRWAIEEHLRKGLPVYAIPDAARTFDDDLKVVEALGVRIIGREEAKHLKGAIGIELRDIDLGAIENALEAFSVVPGYDGLAVAVLDHGEAPPDTSDRVFRFQHLRQTLERRNNLLDFAYISAELPPYLTRMKAIIQQLRTDSPVLLLDTGAAATLGALEDRQVSPQRQCLIVNVGNMHTMAIHMEDSQMVSLLEHHTGMLTTERLDWFLEGMVMGTLTHEEVFNDGGHGYYVARRPSSSAMPFLGVTGPRRRLLSESRFKPYFAVPHGDMMLSGCFGLLRAFAFKIEAWREEIEKAL